jgi:hypothetical protein
MARRRPTEPTVNPARGAALVVAAIVVGLLLLRNGIDASEVVTSSKGDDSSADDDGGNGGDGETDGAETTETTVAARTPAEVTVIVLNGTAVSGAAGKYATALQSAGYTMLESGNAAVKIPATQVFFTEGFDVEAAAVALAIGAPATVTPAALPTPPPGEVGAANVVVVIGSDLAELTPTTAAATTTTAA